MTYITKFILNVKIQSSGLWNIPKLGFCCNLVAFNFNFKSEWVFWNTKIYRKWKFKGSVPGKNWKCISTGNLEQKIVSKFTKLSKIICFWNVLRDFLTQMSKFVFFRPAHYSPTNPTISGIVVKNQEVTKHSISGDINRVPFHLSSREIVLKCEKACKCFVNIALNICIIYIICRDNLVESISWSSI